MVFYSRKIVLLIVIIIVFACQDDTIKSSFYTYRFKQNDVARIPIIYPYEIQTAYCCEKWNLDRFSKLGQVFHLDLEIDSIGYHKKYIFIYNEDELKKGHYFILNIIDSIYRDTNSINDYRNTYDVKLYTPRDVFNYLKKNKYPPWINATAQSTHVKKVFK